MYQQVFWLCLVTLAVASPPLSRTRGQIEDFKKSLESTREDDGVQLSARMAEHPQASVWENSGKFQGDMLLTDLQVQQMVDNYAVGRNARINNRWPNNTIIWEFGEGEFDEIHEAAILEAMRSIEENTCIRFKPREEHHIRYVGLTGTSSGCFAHVGFWMSLGAHTLNLARNTPPWGCFSQSIIIHEFFHTLGLHHMHSAPDRDEYVEILYDNIQEGYENAFIRYSEDIVTTLALQYEYTSTLHYNAFAFSKNGEPTIQALQSHEGRMGQRDQVTERDWLRVNRFYDCPGAWDPENEV